MSSETIQATPLRRFEGRDLPTGEELHTMFPKRVAESFVGTREQIADWRHDKTFLEYVYFIGAPEVQRIKIGYSERDPEKRLSGLRGSSPCPLEPLGIIRGNRTYESAFHRFFEPLRSHNEWFRTEPCLVDFIARYALPWPKRDEPLLYLDFHDGYEHMSVTIDLIEEWADRRIRPIYGWPLPAEC